MVNIRDEHDAGLTAAKLLIVGIFDILIKNDLASTSDIAALIDQKAILAVQRIDESGETIESSRGYETALAAEFERYRQCFDD